MMKSIEKMNLRWIGNIIVENENDMEMKEMKCKWEKVAC